MAPAMLKNLMSILLVATGVLHLVVAAVGAPADLQLPLAVFGALYAALGVWLLLSLLYLVLDRELNRVATAGALVLFALTIAAFVAALVAQRRPKAVRRVLSGILYGAGRPFLRRRWSRERTEEWSHRVVSWLRDEAMVVRDQLMGNRRRALQLGALAVGYWAFDALCLIVVFLALGVGFGPAELLVAYGIATVVGNLPLTPGGLGTFEATMLGTLALLGYGPEAAIPVLGYLDDLVLVPLGIALVIRMIPAPVLAECRQKARTTANKQGPKGTAAAILVILTWLLLAALALYLIGKLT